MGDAHRSSSSANFDLCECFLAHKLYQKTEGHMFAPKIGRSGLTGLICGSHWSDRCGQSTQNTNWTSPLDRCRRVDQDSYVECPNQSPDEGDMTSPRSTRRVHRSDWCPPPILSQIEESLYIRL
jgi:hypothetical protein